MSRPRRAVVLALLALLLGGLAAADVAGRENALRESLGAPVGVLVTQQAIAAGQPLERARLALRRVPARYAPAEALGDPADVAGLEAAVAIAPGTDLTASLVADPSQRAGAAVPVDPGERVAELVAMGSPEQVVRGSRVDVLVTRDTADQKGETTLALEDAEVLSAAPAPSAPAARGEATGPRVAVSLRVRLREAVYLAAAQSFARELRILARADGDRRRGAAGLRVGSGL